MIFPLFLENTHFPKIKKLKITELFENAPIREMQREGTEIGNTYAQIKEIYEQTLRSDQKGNINRFAIKPFERQSLL
jgi:hypothetical protein